MFKRMCLQALLAVSVCVPVAAQQLSPDWTRCANKGAFSLDVQISACAALLQSGLETGANRAIVFNNRADGYHRKGEYDRAIADYTEAIRLDPLPRYYSDRGESHRLKGDSDRAIADYNEAIKLKSGYDDAYYNRGIAYRAKGDLDRAIADFSTAIRLNPAPWDAYHQRGLAFEALGRREEAIADFRSALSRNPNNQSSREALKRLGASP